MCVFHRFHPPCQDGCHPSLHHNDTLNWLRQINLMYHGTMLGFQIGYVVCYEQWVGIHQEWLLLVPWQVLGTVPSSFHLTSKELQLDRHAKSRELRYFPDARSLTLILKSLERPLEKIY